MRGHVPHVLAILSMACALYLWGSLFAEHARNQPAEEGTAHYLTTTVLNITAMAHLFLALEQHLRPPKAATTDRAWGYLVASMALVWLGVWFADVGLLFYFYATPSTQSDVSMAFGHAFLFVVLLGATITVGVDRARCGCCGGDSGGDSGGRGAGSGSRRRAQDELEDLPLIEVETQVPI